MRAFFKGRKARQLPDLVTALVTRDGTRWSARFISDGRKPQDFVADSLEQLVQRADLDVSNLYPAADPTRATAELMYAIYPTDGSKLIFEVAVSDAGMTAHSIEDASDRFAADNLDDLAAIAPATALLQWTKPVRELIPDS